MAHTEEHELNKGDFSEAASNINSAVAKFTKSEGVQHNVFDRFGGTIKGTVNEVVDSFQESEESKSS